MGPIRIIKRLYKTIFKKPSVTGERESSPSSSAPASNQLPETPPTTNPSAVQYDQTAIQSQSLELVVVPNELPPVDTFTTTTSDNLSITPRVSAAVTPSSPNTLRRQTVKNIFKETLSTLSSFSEGLPIPGVKGIVDTLIKLIRIVEVTQANQEALEALNERCRRIIGAVAIIEPSKENRAHGNLNVSQDLKQRIDRLHRRLLQTLENAKEYQDSRNSIINAVNLDDDSSAIKKINDAISGHVEHFFLESTISDSVKLGDIHRRLSEPSNILPLITTRAPVMAIEPRYPSDPPIQQPIRLSCAETLTIQCLDCDRKFGSIDALLQHCNATLHDIGCRSCDRWFSCVKALEQHIRASPAHNIRDFEYEMDDNMDGTEDVLSQTVGCLDCNREFSSTNALQQHCFATYHTMGCRSCDRCFNSLEALEQHMRDSPAHYSHRSDNEVWGDVDGVEEGSFCASCNRWFTDRGGLVQHLLNSYKHNWCFPCSRNFGSPEALNQHISSPIHNGRAFDCFFCDRTFNTPSAIAMHIESGCHQITRHEVTAAVHKIFPSISADRRLAAPPFPKTKVITYSATQLAFNGFAYECYLCRRTFTTLGGLNSHLSSPAHDADEFKCPKCRSEFKLVSGLIQHIESGTCRCATLHDVKTQLGHLNAQFLRVLNV